MSLLQRGILAASWARSVGRMATLRLPPRQMEAELHNDPDVAHAPRRLRVMTWNVQFAGSRHHHFFYDGGPTVSVPRHDVFRSLDAIAEAIRAEDPDLVVLQEVDRGSDRTGRVDQLREIGRRVGLPSWASAFYWRSHVPFPAHEHLGRVDMHLCVLSRYHLRRATRYQLPRVRESWLRQRFDLQRALLDVRLPIAGGGELTVLATHLSAFTEDDTVPRQVAMLRRHMERCEGQGEAWFLAGDLNALPPGDDPSRLGDLARYYPVPSPLVPLFDRFPAAPPVDAYRAAPEAWRTYQPFGGPPQRTLDYVLHGSRLSVPRIEVLFRHGGVSDHLPLGFEVDATDASA